MRDSLGKILDCLCLKPPLLSTLPTERVGVLHNLCGHGYVNLISNRDSSEEIIYLANQ
jgi:hypothetical protein